MNKFFLYFCSRFLTNQKQTIMRVIIQSDYQKMSQWAANHVIQRINEFNPTPDHKFVLGLPTGSSPVGMYNALVEANRAGKVSMSMSVCPKRTPRVIMPSWLVTCSTTSTVRRRISISSTVMPPTCRPSASTMRR